MQYPAQVGVVREIGLLQGVREVNLHVGGQHRQLGAGQAQPGRLKTRLQLLVRGQEFDLAVQPCVRLQVAHQALVHVNAQERLVELTLQQHVLLNIGFKHLSTHLVPQGLDEVGTLFSGKLTAGHQAIHQDLNVHLAVGGLHTGGVVDRVSINDDAVLGGLHTAQLGEAQVAALTHDLGAQLVTVHAQRVVGFIAHLQVVLGGCLHVGADTAVVEQVNRCLQNRREQLRGRQFGHVLAQAQGFTNLRGDLNRLGAARVHAAASGNQLTVVVLP